MRDIKFRAYLWADKHTNDQWIDYHMGIIDFWKSYLNWMAHKELMQYIEFKDRNGEEIYEGDIIIGFCNENHSAVVECDAPDGGYNLRDMDGEYIEIFHNEAALRVIGNIYSNPELLTPLPYSQITISQRKNEVEGDINLGE